MRFIIKGNPFDRTRLCPRSSPVLLIKELRALSWRLLSSSTRSSPPTPPPPLPPPRYVHVSASGDWWIADELFAAKHMQPGDVVSCEVPGDFTEDMGEGWTGEDMRKAFDTKILPEYGREGT